MRIQNLLLILLLCCSCSKEPAAEYPGYKFVGGIDGGVYVSLSLEEKQVLNGIVLYESGDVWYSGQFIPSHPLDNLASVDELLNDIEAWDGDKLIFKDGSTLDSVPRNDQ